MENKKENKLSKTIGDLLFPVGDNQPLRESLERFRISYEAKFGKTDLTKRYTSVWPNDQQDWLLENHPKLYYDGLPPYVQACIKESMRRANQKGNLDDQPDEYVKLYISGQMEGKGYQR